MSDFLNQNVSKKLSLKDIENKLIQERISQEQEIERINKERELARFRWRNSSYLFETQTNSPSAASSAGAGAGGRHIYTINPSINDYVENNYIDDYFV